MCTLKKIKWQSACKNILKERQKERTKESKGEKEIERDKGNKREGKNVIFTN